MGDIFCEPIMFVCELLQSYMLCAIVVLLTDNVLLLKITPGYCHSHYFPVGLNKLCIAITSQIVVVLAVGENLSP